MVDFRGFAVANANGIQEAEGKIPFSSAGKPRASGEIRRHFSS